MSDTTIKTLSVDARREYVTYNRWLTFFVKHGIIKTSEEHKGVVKLEVQSIDSFFDYCKRVAVNEGESFYFKMAEKLGGLLVNGREITSVTDDSHGNTPFKSTLKFKFSDDSGFVMENKIVVNTSILGNSFYQYPCTFHNAQIKGVGIKSPNEFNIKKAFLEV